MGGGALRGDQILPQPVAEARPTAGGNTILLSCDEIFPEDWMDEAARERHALAHALWTGIVGCSANELRTCRCFIRFYRRHGVPRNQGDHLESQVSYPRCVRLVAVTVAMLQYDLLR